MISYMINLDTALFSGMLPRYRHRLWWMSIERQWRGLGSSQSYDIISQALAEVFE